MSLRLRARRTRLALGCLLLACTLPAAAGDLVRPRPGLWEQRSEVRINGTDVMAAMEAARARMLEDASPEQREAIRHRQTDPHVTRTCLTPEKVARMTSSRDFIDALNEDDDKNCRYTGQPAGDSRLRFHGDCHSEAQGPYTMDGLLTVKSPEAFAMTYTGKGSANMGGKAMPMAMEGATDAHWIGADCGEVAPE